MDSATGTLPVGTRALILSKHYFGVLSKSLEHIDIERYYSVLYLLTLHDGCTQKFISDTLAVDKSALVKVLDYLTAKGYVTKRPNPENRREHSIRLSPKGRAQARKVVKAFDKLDRQLFRSIAPSRVRVFLQTLDTLISGLSSLPSNDLFFNYRKIASPRAPLTTHGSVR
jgi:DNA-binding MarR family transcriptional regulator